tara:strand:+ start:131 stop:316 length:186 start_codon:yes stop_codon:yes gene_type:complete
VNFVSMNVVKKVILKNTWPLENIKKWSMETNGNMMETKTRQSINVVCVLGHFLQEPDYGST